MQPGACGRDALIRMKGRRRSDEENLHRAMAKQRVDLSIRGRPVWFGNGPDPGGVDTAHRDDPAPRGDRSRPRMRVADSPSAEDAEVNGSRFVQSAPTKRCV